MPAIWKATYFFETYQAGQTGNVNTGGGTPGAAYGWTESWYFKRDTVNIEEALAFATDPQRYVSPRCVFLVSTVNIRWVRVELVGGNQAKVAPLGFPGHVGQDPLPSPTAALVTFTAPPPVNQPGQRTARRNMLFRGLPTNIASGDTFLRGSLAFQQLLGFCNYMTARASNQEGAEFTTIWSLLIQDPITAWRPITALVPDAVNTRSLVVSATGLTTTFGLRYQIKGAGGFNIPINRTWTALRDGTLTHQVGTSRKTISGAWNGAGQIRPRLYDTAYLRNYAIIGLRIKKTGRPSRGPVGRRS